MYIVKVESALRQNFKSYGAWHHRKWILSKGHSSIDNELHLLDKFQKADSRNFHAWNYRRSDHYYYYFVFLCECNTNYSFLCDLFPGLWRLR